MRSEARGGGTLATNCVFLSAEGCSEGIEGAGGRREEGREVKGGEERGKKSPQPSHQVEH